MTPPPADAPVVLAGSSIFQDWAAADGDPSASSARLCGDRPVLNRALGGTQTVDWLPTLGPLVARLRPAVLCLYVGSNDLASGRPGIELLENLHRLFHAVRDGCPHTRLLYASIIRSAHQSARFADLDRVNDAAAATLDTLPGAGFVDVNPCFHDDGTLVTDLFLEDQVHLRAPAYHRLLASMRPRVAAALAP